MQERRCVICHRTKPIDVFVYDETLEDHGYTCDACFIFPVISKYFTIAFMKSDIVPLDVMLEELKGVNIKEELGKLLTYDDFLRTLYWKIVSDTVKRQSENKCSKCHSRSQLRTHHTDYSIKGEDWKHIGTKLICLCRKCHDEIHGLINSNPRFNSRL